MLTDRLNTRLTGVSALLVAAALTAACSTAGHTRPTASGTGATPPSVFDESVATSQGSILGATDSGVFSVDGAQQQHATSPAFARSSIVDRYSPITESSAQPSRSFTSTGLFDIIDAAGMEDDSVIISTDGVETLSQATFSDEGSDFDPHISPDGSKLVFASTRHSTTADIFVKGPHSHVVTQLTFSTAEDVQPKVSPDGRFVAYASNRTGNWDIFVQPIDGGPSVQVTSSPSQELHPSWSPDGSKIVFSRLGQNSGRWEMWIQETSGLGATHFLGYGMFPEWCPVAGTGADGADRIAFQRSRQRGDRAFSIWAMDFKPGSVFNVTELASSNHSALINPTWSPDGNWIVYAVVPNPSQWEHLEQNKPESSDLRLVSVNGLGAVKLTSSDAVNLLPTWGLDNTLYFVSDRSGHDNIWSMDLTQPLAAANSATIGGAHARTNPGTPSFETLTQSGEE